MQSGTGILACLGRQKYLPHHTLFLKTISPQRHGEHGERHLLIIFLRVLRASVVHTYMPAFVGREQDLETVGRLFQEAVQGKGSVVFITGEAGIGKTTFINEFKARYVDAL